MPQLITAPSTYTTAAKEVYEDPRPSLGEVYEDPRPSCSPRGLKILDPSPLTAARRNENVFSRCLPLADFSCLLHLKGPNKSIANRFVLKSRASRLRYAEKFHCCHDISESFLGFNLLTLKRNKRTG